MFSCTFISPGGGFGNILFQTFCVFAFAKDHNVKPMFNSTYDDPKRPNIKTYSKLLHKLVDIRELGTIRGQMVVGEPNSSSYAQIPNFAQYITGYRQSYKYFERYIPTIRQYLIESEPEIWSLCSVWVKTKTQNTETIMLHVRRSDYLLAPQYHTNLTKEYYQQGLQYIQQNKPNTKFTCLVFSDDIEFCKTCDWWTGFSDIDFVMIEEPDVVKTLFAMMNCKHTIIANSSLSLLGMILGEQPESNDTFHVVPKNWFGPAAQAFNYEDSIPKYPNIKLQ